MAIVLHLTWIIVIKILMHTHLSRSDFFDSFNLINLGLTGNELLTTYMKNKISLKNAKLNTN